MTRDDVSRINRRRWLQGIGAAGIAGIAGCSGNPDDGGDGGDGGSTGGDGGSTPGDGGSTGGDGESTSGDGGSGQSVQTLKFADTGSPSSLDPHAMDFANTPNSYAYPENGYETLIYYEPSQEAITPKPVLATEIPTAENGLITNDGQTIEFPLRQGVTFHTGGEMTAEDVRYSWDRVMKLGLSSGASTMKDSIESMEVVDDYTFRVNLKTSNTPVFLNSTITQAYAAVASKQAIENNGGVTAGQPNQWVAQNSAGTGPYVLGARNPNSIIWEPHQDYWGESGVARVEQQVISDLSARLAKLRRGEVHWAWASPGDMPEVEGIQGVNIVTAPQFNPGGFIFNANIPYDRDDMSNLPDNVPNDFFANKDVRKAFQFAFDWESFLSGTLSGLASRTRQIHVPGMFGFDESAPQLHQDLAKAEEHLKNAGYWEEGFTVSIFNESHPEFDALNVRMKDYMEGLNDRITINSVKEPEGKAVSRHNRDPPGWPVEAHALLPLGADPTPYYQFFLSPNGGLGSRTGIPQAIDQKVPDLVSQSATETNPDKREEIFSQLQQLVYDEAPVALGYAPEIINPFLDCVDTKWSNLWIRPHWKHFSIDNC